MMIYHIRGCVLFVHAYDIKAIRNLLRLHSTRCNDFMQVLMFEVFPLGPFVCQIFYNFV